MTVRLALLLYLALISPINVLGEPCSPTRYATPGDFTANHERFLTGHELSDTADVSSATRCSILCYTEPQCSGFSYWHLEKICVLHGATKDHFSSNISTDASASYYQYKHSSVVSSGEVEMSSTSAPLDEASTDLPLCSEYEVDVEDIQFIDEILSKDNFTLDFSVKMSEGAVLQLCQQDAQENNDPVPIFSIGIGVSGNNRSVIETVRDGIIVANASTPGILSSEEFRQFWVSYQGGLVRFGRAAERQTVLLEHDGRGTVSPGIRRAALTAEYPMKGDWRVLGDACLESD